MKAFRALPPEHTAAHQPLPPPQPAPAALPPQEADLAGYALHRAHLGQPLTQGNLSQLRRAQDAMEITRRELHHGRGNVHEDIARDPSVMARVLAMRKSSMGAEWTQGPVAAGALRAAAARLGGVGMCQEYAESTNLHYLKHLAPGERTALLSSEKLGHTWLEARMGPPLSSTGAGPRQGGTAVMDAWRSGPAVMAQDSANHAIDANDRSGTPYDGEAYRHYDSGTAQEALQRLRDIDQAMHGLCRVSSARTPLEQLAHDMPAHQQRALVRLTSQNPSINAQYRYPDSATLSASFMQRARQAWDTPPPGGLPEGLRKEVMAAAVASAWSPAVRDRTQLAPQIVQAAQHLLRLPTPPLMPEMPTLADLPRANSPIQYSSDAPGNFNPDSLGRDANLEGNALSTGSSDSDSTASLNSGATRSRSSTFSFSD